MKATTKPKVSRPITIFSLATILVILLLFYIDESRHSFKGLLKPVHMLTFFIYAIPTVLAQYLFYNLLTKYNISSGKLFFSVVCGLFVGISFVIGLLYLVN